MAIQDITKPMALDETLQAQNSKIDTLNARLLAIAEALGLQSVIGDTDISGIADGTLTGAVAEFDSSKLNVSAVGVAGGVAELDANGLVPANQLPSFVDDVLNGTAQNVTETDAGTYSATAFILKGESTPCTPEDGKTYVDTASNIQYRWTGIVFVSMGSNLTLGETNRTAYRGDRGKTAYDHSQDAGRVTTATAVGLYKVGSTSEGHISGLTPVQKADITALGIPAQDTTYEDATQSVHGLMSTADKTKLDGISTGANKVEASDTNGNIKIDDTETQVYDDTDIKNQLTTDTSTATGNPINFSTLSAQNAVSTLIDLEPIQDLHGYDKPWTGGAGKNKVNAPDKTNIGAEYIIGGAYSAVDINLPVGTYTYSFECSGTLGSSKAYNVIDFSSGSAVTIATGNLIIGKNTLVFTVSSPITKLKSYTNNDGIVSITNIQIESGETATSFAPYENICPISGRTEIGIEGCGVNIWDEEWETGAIRGADGANVNSNTKFRSKNFIPVTPSSTVYFVHPSMSSSPDCSYFFYQSDYTFISYADSKNAQEVQIPNNCAYIRFSILGTSYGNNIAINYPSTDTTYHPYTKSNDLTISLGQTVYGGSLDVENGVLSVNSAIKSFVGDPTESWGFSSSSGWVQLTYTITDAKNSIYAVCDSFEKIEMSDRGTKNGLVSNANDNIFRFAFLDSFGITSASDWKTWLASNNVTVAYELATPTEIQLAPHEISLLEGVNNISTTGDKITLTYRDGKVATLGDLTSAVDNLDSKIDQSKILTDTATGDKYIFVVTNGVLSVQQISN